MVSIIDLCLVLILALCIEAFVLKSSIISPCFIFVASFVFCAISTYVVSSEWEFEYISIKTYDVIVNSIIIFCVIDIIFRIIFRNKLLCNNIEEKKISVNPKLIDYSIYLNIIGLVWAFYFIMQYVISGDFISMMADYKDTLNMRHEELGIGKTLLNQLNKICIGISYTLLFVYCYKKCNNELVDNKIKNKYRLSFYTFMLFRFFLAGGRQTLIFFIMAWITCDLLVNTIISPKNEIKRIERKFAFRFAMIISAILPLFYYMGRLAGRKEGLVLDAATSYLSTGVYGLEQIISDKYQSSYWGEISFPGLYPLFKLFGSMPENLKDQVFLDFFIHGNTVSLLGRWYWDFGEIGVYILITLVAFIFCYLYYHGIRTNVNYKKRNLNIILYCYSIHILYFAGYDDFAMNFITFTFILICIILSVCYKNIIKYSSI